jgi:hypothetical protein
MKKTTVKKLSKKNSILIYSVISVGIVLSGVLLTGLVREGYLAKVETLVKNSTIEKLVGPLVSFGFMSGESTVIQHATVGFTLDKYVVDPSPENGKTGDEYFANIVSQCVFHSQESFEPLCAICTLKDADGNVIGTGVVGEALDENYVASSVVNIDVTPEIENPPSTDVQKVHNVKIEICKEVNGCTPGYWRQDQHFGSWINPPYSPVNPLTTFRVAFDLEDLDAPITMQTNGGPGSGPIIIDTFGTATDDITLLDAIWAQGGGENKMGRHATAALLNAANPIVNFNTSLDETEIIRLVQIAYGKIAVDVNGIFVPGDFEQIGDVFAAANEAGGDNHCPLGNNPLPEAP